MIDPDQARGTGRLPDEVAELHQELATLQIRERASFGAELRAELEEEWDTGVRSGGGAPGRRQRPGRSLAAAAVVALLFLGLSAPQARAALSDVLGGVRARLVRMLEPSRPVTAAPHAGSIPPPPAPTYTAAPSSPDPTRSASPDGVAAVETTGAAAEIVFPDLVDRGEARHVVEGFYPHDLDRSGIGGTVGLRIFVAPDGSASTIQVMRSSGVRLLDSAAVHAAPHLRFKPARKGGTAVGTWVELGINFAPRAYSSDALPGAPAGRSGRSAP